MNLNKKSPIKSLKTNLTTAFDLPREIMLNLPLITLTGKNSMSIENYKNIIEYNQKKIRISTSEGIITIEGTKLFLKELRKDLIVISGTISNFEYI
ncbi:MAG: sporulation protein YqfC [Clostridiales bacterium]|jgi:sporulation protein YqfC|nr:sporulation protein YqfC [Clostridiales bacterium]